MLAATRDEPTTTTYAGPFYILDKNRDDPSIEWIMAEFTSKFDADEFTSNVGGRVVTAEDGIEDLLTAWNENDFSRQAHYRAEISLAGIRHDLGNLVGVHDEDLALIECYRDSDPSCAVAFRVGELLRGVDEAIAEIIPLGTGKFQGVHIEGPWEPHAVADEDLPES